MSLGSEAPPFRGRFRVEKGLVALGVFEVCVSEAGLRIVTNDEAKAHLSIDLSEVRSVSVLERGAGASFEA